MNLAEHMGALSMAREVGEPAGEKPLELVISLADLRRLPEWLKERPNLRIGHIQIPDLPADTPVEIRFPPSRGTPEIVAGLNGLGTRPSEERVFVHPRAYIVQASSANSASVAGSKSLLSGDLDEPLRKRKPIPDFYDKNAPLLEEAYGLMGDAIGRHTFASRVMTIVTGDPGYLPIASHLEYEHPLVRPEAGDLMIDGGVSDMVWAQEKFAKAVGPEGLIHGFEPIAWMAEKAAATLSAYGNYHLHQAGLADKDGEAVFSSLRDSSHLGASVGAETETCRLASLDSFAEKENLGKVDCVKLDIEGAELAALKGGRSTISRDKPKLIVCLYHKPRDLYEIPLYVRDLSEDYAMTCAHSSPGFTDTILYADARP
ncbi:MAG: FkbM family methyltransferase [Desulfovibrio sp.]|nr:FkbM family methyltransferase [Desulfovibrio sp.]